MDTPDDQRHFRFDPCGCHVSVDAFVENVRLHVESGMGSGEITFKSPSSFNFQSNRKSQEILYKYKYIRDT
jgi:hypothetical protein